MASPAILIGYDRSDVPYWAGLKRFEGLVICARSFR
jgi:hypothetical protein